MNLNVEIKRVVDGVVALWQQSGWDWNQFWWEDGNAACDCNRGDFFNQARQEPEEEEESECGVSRFLVRCTDADTGAILYDEFAAAAMAKEEAV